MEFLAELRDDGRAHDLLSLRPSVAVPAPPPPGTVVHVRVDGDAATIVKVLADAGSARAEVYRVVGRYGLDPLHPPEVEAEARALVAQPGIDDRALEDLGHLPFCTIDNEDSRDLDQALCIEATPDDGHVVWYALADASHYVRPGTALFSEALARGASYYLPGLSVPMLPRVLSEDLVSLNPEVDRRALVFRAALDRDGALVDAAWIRARVRSRAKLSYRGVQDHYDTGSLRGRDVTPTLDHLQTVGRRLIARAEARHVVQYARHEVEVGFADPAGRRFVAFEEPRTDCDRYNEQISLLVNSEGARLLARLADEGRATPVFRVHPEPAPPDVRAFARKIERLVAAHDLPASWRWSPEDEPLATWLARLPLDAVGRAIQRQALLLNQRSMFAAAPGLHYGVGAPLYARFSSPMREIVGVFTHKEALEALAGAPEDPADEALRAAVIKAANASKERQRQLTKAANQLVIDAFLRPGLELEGVVMGLDPGKLYLQLDEPPLELKVYAADLGVPLALEDNVIATFGARRLALGDRLRVRVAGHDSERDRWRLVPIADAGDGQSG